MFEFLPALCMGIITFLCILNLFLLLYSKRHVHIWLAVSGGMLNCFLVITNRDLFHFLDKIDRVWFDLVTPFLFLGICGCILVIFKDFFFRYSWSDQIKTLFRVPWLMITFLGASLSVIVFIFYAQSGHGSPVFNIAATCTYLTLNIQISRYELLEKSFFDESKPVDIIWLITQNGGHIILDQLSKREIEVLELLARGLTDKEIGEHLYLSVVTIKSHARNIYKKLNVKNRTQAGLYYKQLNNHPDFKSR